MNITFLCGSLEPGRDGVGDYTRRLASEMMMRGHATCIISLNDRFVNDVYVGTQQVDAKDIQVVRIASALSKNERYKCAEKWIKAHQTDWISLQYVPFAFHPKGVPFGLGSDLKAIGKQAKWHVMFHEIWLGESSESTFKDKVIGFFQKRIGKHLVKQVNAKAISTTNSYYQDCLRKADIIASKIPVFSNLPLGTLEEKLIYNKVIAEVGNITDDCVIGSFFGRVNVFEDFYNNIFKLKDLAAVSGKKLILTHIGRSGNLAKIAEDIKKHTAISLHILGEADELQIASYLTQIDFGISTYPKILYEKSGSIAAMFNNGLPVVVLKKSFENFDTDVEQIKQIDEIDDFTLFLNQKKSFGEIYGVQSVCDSYFNLLRAALN